MSVFSDAELTYLARGKLGRLATIDGAGMPHVVPPAGSSVLSPRTVRLPSPIVRAGDGMVPAGEFSRLLKRADARYWPHG
jgi:hypothetical protein